MNHRLSLSARSLTLKRLSIMSAPPKQSYASMAGGGSSNTRNTIPAQASNTNSPNSNKAQGNFNNVKPQSTTGNSHPPKRAPSPTHVPRTTSPEKDVYVLTFLTDSKHHKTMTQWRKDYFPARLNKLDAHLTLFHALPGSKLDDEIIPTLEATAKSTEQFHILAATPFRLKHGIAIGVPKTAGGTTARDVHAKLRDQWRPFLSDQDAGGFAAHYTIMNKVDDDKKVNGAFAEVEQNFQACPGMIEGLSLWRYDRSRWEWARDFVFQKGGN